MHFKVGSRSPVTVKMKLFVTTTVNDSFQPLLNFCHEELHLRGHIGLDFNIVTFSTKILKYTGGHPPHDRVQLWENMKNSPSLMP